MIEYTLSIIAYSISAACWVAIMTLLWLRWQENEGRLPDPSCRDRRVDITQSVTIRHRRQRLPRDRFGRHVAAKRLRPHAGPYGSDLHRNGHTRSPVKPTELIYLRH